MDQNEAFLEAVKGYIDSHFDRICERLDVTNRHLERLNGKVAEHERRWTLQDGAEQERAKAANKRDKSDSAFWPSFFSAISDKPYLLLFIGGTISFLISKMGIAGLVELIKAVLPK